MTEKLDKSKKIEESTGFTDIINVNYLNGKNSSFTFDGVFLSLVSDIDVEFEERPDIEDEAQTSPDPGRHGHGASGGPPPALKPMAFEKQHRGDEGSFFERRDAGKKYVGKRRDYGRVFLHRAFPFEKPYGFLSVQDAFGHEIGIIRDISDFDEKTAEYFKEHLRKKYFLPKIIRVTSVRESMGYSYWTVLTDIGENEITLRDPFRSIVHAGEDKIYVTDCDGNRFLIESLSGLDRKSCRKIELYL